MMGLQLAPLDKDLNIIKVKNRKIPESQLRHLNNLGFVEGAKVRVVSESLGNLIVIVKGSRVAIGKDLASAFIVGEQQWL